MVFKIQGDHKLSRKDILPNVWLELKAKIEKPLEDQTYGM